MGGLKWLFRTRLCNKLGKGKVVVALPAVRCSTGLTGIWENVERGILITYCHKTRKGLTILTIVRYCA